jgi:hypothetical protein
MPSAAHAQPTSPVDSLSSRSSGALRSNVSSPTGHCLSPPSCSSHSEKAGEFTNVVFQEHLLDTNESVLFVHKNLRPIKTKPVEVTSSFVALSMLKTLTQAPTQVHSACAVAGTDNNSAGVRTMTPIALLV